MVVDPETSLVSDTAGQGPSLEGGSGSGVPAVTASEGRQVPRGREKLGGRARTGLAIGGSAAILSAIVGVLIATGSNARPAAIATAAPIAGSISGAEPLFDDDAGPDTGTDAASDAPPPRPAQWRVASLRSDENVTMLDGVIDRRPLLVALGAAGLPRGEAQRVTRSLAETRNVDRFGPKDTFSVARDKTTGRVVAYEMASSPADVWQAREEAQGVGPQRLIARKLELTPEPLRVRKAVLVGADLRASLAEAGLGPADEVLTMLDDALEGHAELSEIRSGARIRIVGTQEFVDGEFVRWLSLDAVEYFPAAPSAPSVRVYAFGDEEGSRKHHGWYDAKGKQPVHGGWRMPVPLARIASRFNPHRMHPVLHVVMPHNGVDLAAPAGAPVYATAAGIVASAGFDGPCGNKVEIAHAHDMTSVYCHLSRFAAGLHVGQHVEQRQLIAYVGQTGRVTGPHLHFGMRRGDVFVDPLALRLDGVRVVPHGRRDEFDRLRAELDAELDSIPLPAPTGAPSVEVETETVYEEPPP